MPGGLNGPQLTKICREENLSLLCAELGGGIVGKTSAQYLRALSNLYTLCVRYKNKCAPFSRLDTT